MNTIPMSVLLQVLDALKAAHARSNDSRTPDPYMQILKAEHALEYHIGRMEVVEVTQ